MTFLYKSPSFTTTDRDEFDALFGFKPIRKARVVKAARRIPRKSFPPKPGDPGTVVKAGGRSFEVWSAAPWSHTVWAVPTEARDGDAQVYLVEPGIRGTAKPHHFDGSECIPYVWHDPIDGGSSWGFIGKRHEEPWGSSWGFIGKRHEEPCRHRSHQKDGAS
jgi:hypothetical protein